MWISNLLLLFHTDRMKTRWWHYIHLMNYSCTKPERAIYLQLLYPCSNVMWEMHFSITDEYLGAMVKWPLNSGRACPDRQICPAVWGYHRTVSNWVTSTLTRYYILEWSFPDGALPDWSFDCLNGRRTIPELPATEADVFHLDTCFWIWSDLGVGVGTFPSAPSQIALFQAALRPLLHGPTDHGQETVLWFGFCPTSTWLSCL